MNSFTAEDRELLRDMYSNWSPRSDPYLYFPDFVDYFSPIEKSLWAQIRMFGLPMYPQFPVINYFIDFADPQKKIGIEADGKEFHQDIKKDGERQRKIENLGWKIYHIKGAQILRELPECYEEDQPKFEPEIVMQRVEMYSSEEFLRALKIMCYINNYDPKEMPQM